MQIRGFVRGIMLATAAIMLAGPALSSAAGDTKSKGVPTVSERVARDIAWSFGIVRIDEIVLAGMRWEIAGHDQDGNERLLDISAHDGRLLN
jgi:hypothetical protein